MPAELSLGQLHDVLQIAFGWTNSRLHDVMARGIRFGMADVEDEIFRVDEHAAPLGAVFAVAPMCGRVSRALAINEAVHDSPNSQGGVADA